MNTSFNIKDFRRALGQFPTGVTVITTVDDNGGPVGVTASSFNTVSIDPPLVLWSVDKGAYSADIMKNSKHFAVNVLASDQVATSNKFADRGEDKFAGVSYQPGLGNSPLFDGCAAQFQCNTWNVVDAGDHLIIIGEVVEYSDNEALSPLVFAAGSYAITAPHPSSQKPEQLPLSKEGFLSDYLPFLLHSAYTNSSAALYPKILAQCHITPQEWRVLTLLADHGLVTAQAIGQLIMQPEAMLEVTIERMKEKDCIESTGSDLLALTANGLEIVRQSIILAKEHELSVLQSLPSQCVVDLKQSLKQIGAVSVTS